MIQDYRNLRTSPTRAVTFILSKYSSRGRAYFLLVPINVLNSLTVMPSGLIDSRSLSSMSLMAPGEKYSSGDTRTAPPCFSAMDNRSESICRSRCHSEASSERVGCLLYTSDAADDL